MSRTVSDSRMVSPSSSPTQWPSSRCWLSRHWRARSMTWDKRCGASGRKLPGGMATSGVRRMEAERNILANLPEQGAGKPTVDCQEEVLYSDGSNSRKSKGRRRTLRQWFFSCPLGSM